MWTVRSMTATAAAVLALTVSGCSSSSGPSSSAPITSTTSTSPTGSSAPSTSSTAQPAQAQVIAFIPTYLRMLDDLRIDPTRPLNDIYQVAVAPDATAEASAVGRLRSQGYRQTGWSQLVDTVIATPSSGSDAAGSPSPTLPTVVVKACVDVGQVDAVDAGGKSVVPAGRPGYLVEQLTVVNLHSPDAASWRVSDATNKQAQSCSG